MHLLHLFTSVFISIQCIIFLSNQFLKVINASSFPKTSLWSKFTGFPSGRWWWLVYVVILGYNFAPPFPPRKTMESVEPDPRGFLRNLITPSPPPHHLSQTCAPSIPPSHLLVFLSPSNLPALSHYNPLPLPCLHFIYPHQALFPPPSLSHIVSPQPPQLLHHRN